jgi:two-component system, OmpR family, phosphate regulon sensor histidine kinase PhoR
MLPTMPGALPDHLADEFAQVADQASIGLIRFDPQLRVRTANLSAHRALERRPGSLVGRSVMETFLDHRLETLVRTASEGQVGIHESDPGDRAGLVVRARPATGGGAWVTIENVTELQRLRRIRNEFIDNLSHELRTPLANVRLLTEMLSDELAELDVPERVRERVATIDVESGHLVQMINELLDLSRMENAVVRVRHDEVALGPLVRASLRHVETFAQRQGVTLAVRVPDDLPPVRGDEERLDQLLLNLLHNAIKFSPDGGEVTVAADEHPDAAVVSVIDHGVGIPARDQQRVFERFYKVDRARQRGQGGTGLGLAIARHIAEAHGGSIWLDSVEGEGSTFSFSLPFA